MSENQKKFKENFSPEEKKTKISDLSQVRGEIDRILQFIPDVDNRTEATEILRRAGLYQPLPEAVNQNVEENENENQPEGVGGGGGEEIDDEQVHDIVLDNVFNDNPILEEEDFEKVTQDLTNPATFSQQFSFDDLVAQKGAEVLKVPFVQWRPMQLESINCQILGLNVVLNIATGGGKTLAYMLPILVQENKMALVFFPTKALITDQKRKIKNQKIVGIYTGDSSDNERIRVIEELNAPTGEMKFIFATVEMFDLSKKFQDAVKTAVRNKRLTRLIFDEAHTLIVYRPFRDSYEKICSLVRSVNRLTIGITLLSATIEHRDVRRIEKDFEMSSGKTVHFIGDLNRYNFEYHIKQRDGKITSRVNTVESFINENDFQNSTGIIFCRRKQDCDNVANELSQRQFSATSYHSGVSLRERNFRQIRWMRGEDKIIVATIGFSMGIDKDDVMFIVHMDAPMSIQNLVQKNGRGARRSDLKCKILFFTVSSSEKSQMLYLASGSHLSKEDEDEDDCNENLDTKEKMEEVEKVCNLLSPQNACYSKSLLKCRGQMRTDDCGNCFVCVDGFGLGTYEKDVTEIVIGMLQLLSLEKAATFTKISNILMGHRGSINERLSGFLKYNFSNTVPDDLLKWEKDKSSQRIKPLFTKSEIQRVVFSTTLHVKALISAKPVKKEVKRKPYLLFSLQTRREEEEVSSVPLMYSNFRFFGKHPKLRKFPSENAVKKRANSRRRIKNPSQPTAINILVDDIEVTQDDLMDLENDLEEAKSIDFSDLIDEL